MHSRYFCSLDVIIQFTCGSDVEVEDHGIAFVYVCLDTVVNFNDYILHLKEHAAIEEFPCMVTCDWGQMYVIEFF